MKKTILLASLIAVASMAAGTTGYVEGYNENEATFKKASQEFKVKKIGAKTEVKVKDSGLSFGGELRLDEFKIPMDIANYDLKLHGDTKIFVKYELPEIHKVNSYVKATLNVKPSIVLEGDVSYKLNDLTVGVNTKSELPFVKATEDDLKKRNNKKGTDLNIENTYGANVVSTHKLYVKGNYDVVKDIKAEVEVQHDYAIAKANKETDALKYVSTKFEAAYKEIKGLELKAAINHKSQFNGLKMTYKSIMRDEDAEAEVDSKVDGNRYVHSYEFDAKYTGVKDLELNGKLFVQHLHNPGKTKQQDNAISYGTILGVKYTGVKNLTLSGKGVFAGYTDMKDQANHTDSTHQAYIKLHAGAKYDYKVTDKFTVSPEFNATAVLDNLKGNTANGVVKAKTTDLVLEPKVSMEYKPVESLVIKGNVAVPVKFGQDSNKFNYTQTSLKTSLNVKYTW